MVNYASMPQITKDKIIFGPEDWLAGLDQVGELGTSGRISGHGLANEQRIDTLRQPGLLSPGFKPNDAANISSVTGTILNGVVNSSIAYGITFDGKVQKMTTLAGAVAINTTSPFPHAIAHGAHASHVGSDIAVYFAAAVKKVFYSFYDATDWDVGVYDPVADSFDDDFMSTVPATPLADNWGGVSTADYLTGGQGLPHPLCVGDDDVLYIGSGRFLHAYDGQEGTNGTFYGAVLTLPVGWVITAMAKRRDKTLAIAAYKTDGTAGSDYYRGEAKVFMWDYRSLDPFDIYDLHDNYVSELFSWRGTLACFTQGVERLTDNNQNKLKILNGNDFETLLTYTLGSVPCRGGVEVLDDDLLWNAGTYFYQYGRPLGSKEWSLGSPLGTGSGNPGMCRVFANNKNIIYSTGQGVGAGCVYARNGYNSSAVADSKVAYLEVPPEYRGRLLECTVYFYKPVIVTTGLHFSLTTSLDDTVSAIVFNDVTTTGIIKVARKNFDGSPLGDFVRLQIEALWGAGDASVVCPLVRKIEFRYELIRIALQ